MSQFVINRMDKRINFTSDAFIHEIEYGTKNGKAVFKTKTVMFGM